jgi:mono/diheme cytochrome c family protein
VAHQHEKIFIVIFRNRLIISIAFLLPGFFVGPSAHALFASKTQTAEMAGAVLFRDKGCSYCHGAGGTGGKKGPDLSGIRVQKQWTPDKIRNQILNGGQKMPPFSDSVTDQEITELVAYLRARHRPIPPPAANPTPAPASAQ